ncbi:hypothetical protein [Nodularia chucula]|uniref:hypothetical protein n=1 Tax=Nodularia chucula TaxID=3093667 RepID=UPI0039C66AC7
MLGHKCRLWPIVKVLDYKSEREDWQGDYNIYRIVEVLWTIDCTNPPVAAKANAIFDYQEVLDYRSGNIMRLEDLPTFKEHWDTQGGLLAFQEYVQSRLAVI